MHSISLEELKTHRDDKEAHVLYMLRVGAFKSMAALARDLGVKNDYIRQVKFRKIINRPNSAKSVGYAKAVQRLWING